MHFWYFSRKRKGDTMKTTHKSTKNTNFFEMR
jgi:hypothetical protein